MRKNVIKYIKLFRAFVAAMYFFSFFMPFYLISLWTLFVGNMTNEMSFDWPICILIIFPVSAIFIIVSTINGELDKSNYSFLILILPLLCVSFFVIYILLKIQIIFSVLNLPLFSFQNYGVYVLVLTAIVLPFTRLSVKCDSPNHQLTNSKEFGNIIKYYDYTHSFYKFFWYGKSRSYAIHYGLWEEGTKSLGEALLNTNKILSDKAGIKKNDKILDAGCGIGGSSIWIAKNLQAKITGISLSEKQIFTAKKIAKTEGVENSIKFFVMDFSNTSFPDESFDVVWAVESVCHANDKKEFLKEVYRVLKPNGKLIVADGFLRRLPEDQSENRLLNNFMNGFAVNNMSLLQDFENAIKIVGFKSVTYWDKTKEILPTSKKLFHLCKWGHPLSLIAENLSLTSPILTKNNLGGILQYRLINSGIGGYAIFLGVK